MELIPLYTPEIKASLKAKITIEVGKRVEELRKERGYSQEQLGHLIDSNKQNIYKIESGLYTPTISTLYFLSKALECDISDLVPDSVE